MSTNNILPNLLLAGAPKCGTTSVYDWLIRHPDISGGVDKELFYLMDPSDWKYNPKHNFKNNGFDGYSKFFKEQNKYVVDGTTLTIYQESAIDYVINRSQVTKMILFVREPSDRIYSTFKYFRDTRTVLPAEMTFCQFISEVKSGNKFNGNNQLYQVIEQCNYFKYINKWANAIGKENIKIVDFESLKSNKHHVMVSISNWLEIDANFYENFEFTHKNETSVVRNRTVNSLKESIGVKIKSEKFKKIIRPLYNFMNKKKPNNSLSESEVVAKNNLRNELETEFTKAKELI